MNNILGQQQPLHILTQALNSERMHHAWIFHGPMGVGKFTTVMALAKELLCHERQTDLTGQLVACESCASCKLLNSPEGAHPDIHVVRKELAQFSDDASVRRRKLLNIPVDVIRQHLLEPAYHSAQMNHGKVLILDEAELMNNEGQNALLKTLEEPPARTFIFLITSNENLLLPTLRSRSQRVAFARLSDEDVSRWLDQYFTSQSEDEEPVSISDDARQWVIWYAQGSLGKAKLAVDYQLYEWGFMLTPLIERIAQGMPADSLGQTMQECVDQFAKSWVDNHDNASKDAANKAGVRYLLDLIGSICRKHINTITQQMQGEDTIEMEDKLQPWLRGIDLLQGADRNLNANVAMALILDHLVIQWSRTALPA